MVGNAERMTGDPARRARGGCAETISLSLPADRRYAAVARIVVGGLAARLNMSYESLDDLQLAVETLLGEQPLFTGARVDLDLAIHDGMLTITIGPIDARAARVRLDDGGDLPLQTVLAAVVDETVVDEATSSLRLRKDVPMLRG